MMFQQATPDQPQGFIFDQPDSPEEESYIGALSTPELPLYVPDNIYLAPSNIPAAGTGAHSKLVIPLGTRFGPYLGGEGEEQGSWQKSSDGFSDQWMGFVNRARHQGEQTLLAFQFQGCVYYEAIIDIKPNCELLIWYDDLLAKTLGILTLADIAKDSDEVYVCLDCKRSFFYPNSLIWHRMHACGGTTSLLWCDECGKILSTPALLKSHLIEHVTEQQLAAILEKATSGLQYQDSFPCESCMFVGTSLSDIQEHSETEHPELNEVPTEASMPQNDSQKGTKTKAPAAVKRETKKKKKKIQCDICGKEFSTPWTLKEHTRTHTGDKPFKCTHCEKPFAHHSNMVRHLRTHTGERPFKCPFCGKGFSVHSNLTAHLPTHSGLRQFRCSVCFKSFVHASSLHKHMKNHQGLGDQMIEMINLSNNISQQDTHSIHGNLDNNDIQSNISNQDIIHGNLGNYGEGSYIANTTVHPTSPVKSHRMTSLHEHNMVRPIMINSHGNQYGNQHVNQLGNQGNQHVNQLGNQGNQLVNQLGNQGNQLVNQLGNQGNQHVNQLGNQGNQHVNQLGNQGNQHVNQLGNQGNQHVNQLGNQGNQHVNQLGNQQVNQLGNQGNQHGNQYGNVHGNQYGIQHGNHGNQAMVSGNWGNQAAGIINGALASAIINAGISPSSVDQLFSGL